MHAQHLNYFTNGVGLAVHYSGYLASGETLRGPVNSLTNNPSTYASADWCGRADDALRSVTFHGTVINVLTGEGDPDWTVSLLSGPTSYSGILIRTVSVNSNGQFGIGGQVANDQPIYLRLDTRAGYSYLPPQFVGPPPSAISGNTVLTYPVCFGSGCLPAQVGFRIQPPPGPVSLTAMSPSSGSPELILRDTPLKILPSTIVTLTGVNLHTNFDVYLSKCSIIPPSPESCTEGGDLFRCTILSNDATRNTLTVQLPALSANPAFSGAMQWVLHDLDVGHPGWTSWIYGPSGFVVSTYHPYPVLHGFEFQNEDDGPSIQEFEACYGYSIFFYTPVPLRDPFYALWSIVYMAWMDGAHGSCYGMASTSRLLEEGTIPLGIYDGGHGVHFANGFPGNIALPPVAPKPGLWTGFDLFQPFRPFNLWAQITANAGAQTSGEAIGFWLSQMRTPQTDGERRGLNCGDPVAVLNRVRARPGEYLVCVGDRDFGRGHCLTPYGVLDEQGLMPDLRTPTNAPGFSLIRVYDNNHPGEERFVLVDRGLNIFRYDGDIDGGPYAGPGLFWTPMSLFRNARHAPGPEVLASHGIDFLRVLTLGAASATFTNAAGEAAGWSASGLNTNGYAGALHYQPQGVLPDGVTRFDTTMLFLPLSNAPAAGHFASFGSNVLVHGAMGWGDIAFGFNAPNTTDNNAVDGILIGLNQGLQAMGFRAGAPVNDFGAMVASRTAGGESRVFLIDAGVGEMTPDLALERDALSSLKIHNRSTLPFGFRLNLAGTDAGAGSFEHAYEFYTLPPHATLTLRLPARGADPRLTRELDLDSDGTPELIEELPANGQLRASKESSQLALRWRQAARTETLESAPKLSASWWPVASTFTNDGPDRIARVNMSDATRFFRLKLTETNCFGLAAEALGARPNPWDTNGYKFEVISALGAMFPQNEIVTRGDFTGLDVVHTLRVHPHDDYQVLHLDVFQTSGYVVFEAVGPLGVVVARSSLIGPGTGPQRVTLRGFRGRLQYVRVISPNAKCLLLNVCGERKAQTETSQPPPVCLSFESYQAQVLNNPTFIEFAGFFSDPGPLVVEAVSGTGVNGLKFSGKVTVTFTGPGAIGPCHRVTLRVLDSSGGAIFQAYDGKGVLLDSANTVVSPNPQTIVLEGTGIGSLWLNANQKGHLLEICVERSLGPGQ